MLMFLELQLLSLQFKTRNNVLGFNLILEEIVKALWFCFSVFSLHQMLVDHSLLQRLRNLQEAPPPPPPESQKALKPPSPQNYILNLNCPRRPKHQSRRCRNPRISPWARL